MSYLPDYKEPIYPSEIRRREEAERLAAVRKEIAQEMKVLGQLLPVVSPESGPLVPLRIVK